MRARPAIGVKVTHQRRGTADSSERSQIAAAITEGLKRGLPCAAMVHGVLGDGEHHDATGATWNFVAAMIGLVVCGCILKAETEKAPLATAQ